MQEFFIVCVDVLGIADIDILAPGLNCGVNLNRIIYIVERNSSGRCCVCDAIEIILGSIGAYKRLELAFVGKVLEVDVDKERLEADETWGARNRICHKVGDSSVQRCFIAIGNELVDCCLNARAKTLQINGVACLDIVNIDGGIIFRLNHIIVYRFEVKVAGYGAGQGAQIDANLI